MLWKTGTHNLADYPTKHNTTYHNWQIRPMFLKPTAKNLHNAQDKLNSKLQGCIKSSILGSQNPVIWAESSTTSMMQNHEPPFQNHRVPCTSIIQNYEHNTRIREYPLSGHNTGIQAYFWTTSIILDYKNSSSWINVQHGETITLYN